MANSPINSADVVIAGCGPAGALLGILLARQGYDVVALTAALRGPRIEGLGQRTIDVLKTYGLTSALATVGEPVQRRAIWNGETADYNHEFITTREAFDAALQDDARAGGVNCLPLRCGTVDPDGPSGKILVTCENNDQIAARFFVEARGRAAPRIREGGLFGPATTAMLRELKPAGAPGTAVESFKHGWAWYVSTGRQSCLQIFVDSGNGLPKRADLAAFFEQQRLALRAIPEVAGTEPCTGPAISRSAACWLSGDIITDRTLRLGDAGVAIDPLSGHGLFAAFGSALAASATINTILKHQENAAVARRFYKDRARDSAMRNARIGRDFYRMETRWSEEPFWAARQTWPDDEPAHGDPGSTPVSVQNMPVVANGFIKEDRVIVTADHPRGVWRVDDVALAPLLDRLKQFGDQPKEDLVEHFANEFKVQPSQIVNAIRWLRSAGAIS